MPALIARAIPLLIVLIVVIISIMLAVSAWRQIHEEYGSFRAYFKRMSLSERVTYMFLLIITLIVTLSWMTQ